MDFQEAWQMAGKHTRIVRARKNMLYTFGSTKLPYVCISRMPEDEGEVCVRRGEVTADRPKIAIPGHDGMKFEGFDLEGFGGGEEHKGQEGLPVFLARRIEMPAANYVHTASGVRRERRGLEEATDREVDQLEKTGDIRTAVIQAPEQAWMLSVLMYVGTQIVRSAPGNIGEHLERLRLQGGSF